MSSNHQEQQQKDERPQQIRHPIDKLPMFREMIQGMLADTAEQHQTFLEVKRNPHLVDDATVQRAMRAYQTQLEYIPLHERQMVWWLEDELSSEQRQAVTDLQVKLSRLRELTEANLVLLGEISQGTINRILEMDDSELGLAVLRGQTEGWNTTNE